MDKENITFNNGSSISSVSTNDEYIRGQRANIMFVGEDYIDLFLKEHWIKFNRVVHMIKHGRSKRIRNKYINIYERERRFIIFIMKEIYK